MSGFIGRLRNRADSEHEQAIVRIVIVTLLAVYFFVLTINHSPEEGAFLNGAYFASGYLVLSVIYLALIAIWPQSSPLRRLIAMVTDFITVGMLMFWGSEPAAALYPIYLWITLGNGFRYGNRYLASSALVSMISFLTVCLTSVYWSEKPFLASGLIFGLLALPAYVATLIRKLTEAKAQAETANRAKSRFLAAMSHELRTPLNAIIGIGGLLQGSRLTTEQREMTRTIDASAKALLRLIDRVLDLSRIEAGSMPVEINGFELDAELADLAAILEPQANAKGLQFRIHVDSRIPLDLRGGQQHLRQILTNLIANAIKFTDRGAVSLRVGIAGDPASTPTRLRFSVSDTGVGIAPGAQERIFEQFSQEDESISRKYGGAGLGLAISRQLAELLGGTIGVDSEIDAGSTFWVELPFEAGNDDEASETPSRIVERIRLITTDQDFADALRDALAPEGTILSVYSTVEGPDFDPPRQAMPTLLDAKSIALENEDTDRILEALAPAALICGDDVAEPAASGQRLAARVLTTLPWPTLALRIRNTLRLLNAFNRKIEETQDEAYVPLVGPPPGRSLKVLVADDNAVNRRVTAKILERGGHRAVLVETGDEALDALDEDQYDLVLMDVNMPGTSGLDATRLYRFAHLGEQRLPIIALTADATPDMKKACEEAGMDAYVTKPVEAAKLLEVVLRMASGSAPEGQETGAAATPLTGQVTAISSHPRFQQESDQVVDEAALDRLGEIDPGSSFVRTVLEEFIKDADQLVSSLIAAGEAGDPREIYDLAHALRSSATHVGAVRLQRECADLCTATRDTKGQIQVMDISHLREQLSLFRAAVAGHLAVRADEDRRS